VYTAFARDTVRGVEPPWVRNLYRFAARPDLALYFDVPIEVSLDRLTSARANIKYHEAGMDLGLANNVVDSFRIFQGRVLDEYHLIASEFGLLTVDARTSIREQQDLVRNLADKVLAGKTLRRVKA
jgi:dTMP kinase